MILKGNRRGGGMQLAHHLQNAEDNEQVTVHELRGFVSDTLAGALNEVYGIAKGTRCTKFLYSLSLSPPQKERVPVEAFEKAIMDVEEKLGLVGQPRAIVFHEKEGRRHAHCVWSRIDVREMKAIDPSFDKLKLRDMSRQLYLDHGWQMPRGLMNSQERDPLNFTMAELQQARRAKQDVRSIKEAFVDCWAVSDNRAAFGQALEERGYYLAQGRRGHVAVDWRGEIYAISKWVGVRARDVRARLGEAEDLPSVGETKERIRIRFTDKLEQHAAETERQHDRMSRSLEETRRAMVSRHRDARQHLNQKQDQRRIAETRSLASLLPTGLKALWFRVTGKYQNSKRKTPRKRTKARRVTVGKRRSWSIGNYPNAVCCSRTSAFTGITTHCRSST